MNSDIPVGIMKREKMLFLMWLLASCVTTLIAASPSISFGRVYVNEFFSTKIEPKLFNWTLDAMEQFKYRASLHGHPDLPIWMRFMYSHEHHAGYLYGTPPDHSSGQEVSGIESGFVYHFLTNNELNSFGRCALISSA